MYPSLRRWPKPIITLIIAILAAALLQGCGFHLRGWNQSLPKMMKNVYVDDNDNSNFNNVLTQQLNAAGANVVSNKSDATSIIHILSTESKNQPVDLIGSLGAREYTQEYAVAYEVLDNRGNVLLDKRYISASQNYSGNATQQLSLNNQVAHIIDRLQIQVAKTLVNQLYVLQPKADGKRRVSGSANAARVSSGATKTTAGSEQGKAARPKRDLPGISSSSTKQQNAASTNETTTSPDTSDNTPPEQQPEQQSDSQTATGKAVNVPHLTEQALGSTSNVPASTQTGPDTDDRGERAATGSTVTVSKSAEQPPTSNQKEDTAAKDTGQSGNTRSNKPVEPGIALPNVTSGPNDLTISS